MNQNRTPIGQLTAAGAAALHELGQSPEQYAAFLQMQGCVFKHSTHVALAFFAQNPQTAYIATREQWEKMQYTVTQGADAVRYVSKDGAQYDLYDFSQIEQKEPPQVWAITLDNAAAIKAQLGKPDAGSVLMTALQDTLTVESIADCMRSLRIPPSEFGTFRTSYVTAVQTIMAGRLSLGGGRFPVKPDSTAFMALADDTQRYLFLSHAARDARAALMRIEDTIHNLNEMERNEQYERENELRELEQADYRGAAERAGRLLAGDPAGDADEQPDERGLQENGRRDRLGDDAAPSEREQHAVVPGVQAEGDRRDDVLVPLRSDERDVQHEPDGERADTGRGADGDVWDALDGLHGAAAPGSGRADAVPEQLPDGGTVGGQIGAGVPGASGRAVRADESSPDGGLRGDPEVGGDEKILHGRDSDAGARPYSDHDTVTDKENSEHEASTEKSADASIMPETEPYLAERQTDVPVLFIPDSDIRIDLRTIRSVRLTAITEQIIQHDESELLRESWDFSYDAEQRVIVMQHFPADDFSDMTEEMLSPEEAAAALAEHFRDEPNTEKVIDVLGEDRHWQSLDDYLYSLKTSAEKELDRVENQIAEQEQQMRFLMEQPDKDYAKIAETAAVLPKLQQQAEALRAQIKAENAKHFQVYQIKNDEQYRGIRFERYAENKDQGLNISDYDLVYTGDWDAVPGETVQGKLERIYSDLNTGAKPEGFTGRSLSMSDVITVPDGTAYYVDRGGFAEMAEFSKTMQDRFRFYVIKGLKTWANNEPNRSALEKYDTLDEALTRFRELRGEPFNSEAALNPDGMPYARLTLGVSCKDRMADADLLHVRDGKNSLVTDFTRSAVFCEDPLFMRAMRQIADTVGFERVVDYDVLADGRLSKPVEMSYPDWLAKKGISQLQPMASLAVTKRKLQLTETEQEFMKEDLAPGLAQQSFSWDELEDMGYILFQKGYPEKHHPSEKAIYGGGMREPELYELARRFHAGEDIRADLGKGLLGFLNDSKTSRGYAYDVKRDAHSVIATMGNAVKAVTFEEIGGAMLSLIKREHDLIAEESTVQGLLDEIPVISEDGAKEIMQIFEDTKQDGWEDSVKLQDEIRRALTARFGNPIVAEKGLAVVAEYKYNVEIKPLAMDVPQTRDNEPISLRLVGDSYEVRGKDIQNAAALLGVPVENEVARIPANDEGALQKLRDAGYVLLMEKVFALNPPKQERILTLDDVVRKFFEGKDVTITSDDGVWKMEIGQDDVLANVYHNDNPECRIIETQGKYIVEPDHELSAVPAMVARAMQANVSRIPTELAARIPEDADDVQLTLFGDAEPLNQHTSTRYQDNQLALVVEQPGMEMLDNILRGGASDPHSLERIVAYFQKGKSVEDNAAFLREEFGQDGRGYIHDDLTEYAAWFDKDGITAALGTTAFPDQGQVHLTWEQAAERISAMLESGTFCDQVHIDHAEENELKDISDSLLFLDRDTQEEPILAEDWTEGVFPDAEEKVIAALKVPELLQETIDRMQSFVSKYREYPGIVPWYQKPEKLLQQLTDLQIEHADFITQPDFTYKPLFFISDDQKDNLLRSHGGGKFRIDAFFKEQHTNPEIIAFLKREYGEGGFCAGGYDEWHSAKGISLTFDGFGKDAKCSASMKWNEVAKRISRMIAENTYITQEDIDQRIRSAQYDLREHPDTPENAKIRERAMAVLDEYRIPMGNVAPQPEHTTETAYMTTDGERFVELMRSDAGIDFAIFDAEMTMVDGGVWETENAPDFGFAAAQILGTAQENVVEVADYAAFRALTEEDADLSGLENLKAETLGITETQNEQPKIYQLVTYDEDTGDDDKKDYPTLEEAIEDGRQYLAQGYDGFAVLNSAAHRVEHYEGDFPLTGIFSERVYKNTAEWHRAAPQANESPIHAGLFGNGITYYDTSRTDPETNDFPTVAHVSPEGKMTIYDRAHLPDGDLMRIQQDARTQHEKFERDWNSRSITGRFAEILERANTQQMIQIGHDPLSMEEKVAKYERSVIFEDEPFPLEFAANHKNPDSIAVGDRFRYQHREYTVTALEGIYPNDVTVSTTSKTSTGAAYTTTMNLDRDTLLREGEFLGEEVIDNNQTAKEASQTETPAPKRGRPTRAEQLYTQFCEQFPDMASGEHTYERYGTLDDASGWEPLSVEHLGDDVYSFTTFYIQNGDLMHDPDFTFRLDHENRRVEMLEYQQDGVPPYGTVYERVEDAHGNVDKNLRLRWKKTSCKT